MDTRFTYVNIFALKTLSKVETFENAAKEMLCKCLINVENVNHESTNAETGLCLTWSVT